MDLKLAGKHVLITGAAGDIGLQLAKSYLSQGSKVSLHYHTSVPAEFVELAKNPATISVQASAESEDQVVQAVAKAVERFGPVHILVLNHAIFESEDRPIWEMPLTQWKRTIDVNLTGSFLFAREFAKNVKIALDKGHKIDHISLAIIGSTAGKFGEAGHSDYASSKSALMYGFLKSVKNELVKLVPLATANAIAPGWVETKMAAQSVAEGKHLKALKTMPLRKLASVEDVANSVLIATSSVTGGHLTGNIISIDGGMEGRCLWDA